MTEISSGAPQSRQPGAADVGQPLFERVYVWELPVRIFHWVNAASIVVLFATGLYIAFPYLGPSGEPYDQFVMGYVRLVHFATAFVFTVNFLARIYWFFAGNRFARSGIPWIILPSWWRSLFRDIKEYALHRYQHPHLGHGALSGLTYTLIAIGLGWAQIFTGFGLYGETNPGGFWDTWFGWVLPLLGGSMQTHTWHHLFAWGFVAFIIVHVYIVLLDDTIYRNGLVSSIVSGIKLRRVRRIRARKGRLEVEGEPVREHHRSVGSRNAADVHVSEDDEAAS